MLRTIARKLPADAPFAVFWTVAGIVHVAMVAHVDMPRPGAIGSFWTLRPIQVLLSTLVTAGMCPLDSKERLWRALLIGCFGSEQTQ